MKRAGDVFERNLALLLQRAYAPVLPRESFRVALERDVLARAARLAGSGPAPRARRPALWLVPLAAAAALAAFLFGGPWGAGGEVDTLETLLARGQAAARRDPAGHWTAVRGELAHAGGALELVTPAGVEARVSSAAVGFELSGGSHLAIGGEGAARLLAGGVSLRHAGGAGPFLLATAEGEVELVAGRVRVAHEPPPDPRAEEGGWVRVVVRAGESRAGPERLVLGPGREVFLRDGRVFDPAAPAGPSVAVGAGRTEVAPAPAAAGAEEPTREPTWQLTGVVVLRGEPPLPAEDFKVVVLRQVPLPQIADPRVFPFRDAEGRFELDGLEPGQSEVFVHAAGRALWRSGTVRIGAPGEAPVGPLAIALEEGVVVRGLVVDGETGLPLPGAVVLSETDAPAQVLEVDLAAEEDDVLLDVLRVATTRIDGGFELRDVSRGQQVFRAWVPGYGPSWIGPIEVGDAPLELEFDLDPGGRVTGVVLGDDGAPLATGLLVLSITDFGPGHPIMSYRHAITDAEGRYAMTDVPEGSWTLLSFGLMNAGAPFEPALEFVEVFSGETTVQDFRPPRDGVLLAGRLAYTGDAPVAHRSLWVIPATARGPESMSSTLSGADGSFAFPLVEPERYVVFVSGRDPADMTVLGEVDVADGIDRTDLAFTLAGGSLSGVVLDGASGAPVQAASVLLLKKGADGDEFTGRALTGADGRYAFESVGPGRYGLVAYGTAGPHGQTTLDHLEIGPGESITDLTVHLQPGGSLELRVLTPEGDPVRGAKVWTRNAEGEDVQLVEHCYTDVRGRLAAPGMAAGRWTVIVAAEGFARGERTVEVPVAEEPVRVELRLERE